MSIHTHNHTGVWGDANGIGQLDQSLLAGWESLERKAVVWCLISRSPGADGRRAVAKVKEHACVCVRREMEEGKKNRGSDR